MTLARDRFRGGEPGTRASRQARQGPARVHPIAALQRAAGNRAVTALLGRRIQRQDDNSSSMEGLAAQPRDVLREQRLDELSTEIEESSINEIELRRQIEAINSSPNNLPELQQQLNDTRIGLIAKLEERLRLLDAEIGWLIARIGPAPVSTPGSTELEDYNTELVRREQERTATRSRLRPLQRWRTRQEIARIDADMAEIDQELAGLPPVSDPDDPRAEELANRRASLERRKRELAASLTRSTLGYRQGDPRWGAIRYGASAECTNIAAAGCGPTSLAILLNYLYQEDPESLAAGGNFEIVTPRQTATYAATHGRVCNSGTSGDVMVTNVATGFPGFRGQRITLAQAAGELRSGNLVIFLCHSCVGQKADGSDKSYGGHFMVLSGVNDDATVYNVVDPAGLQVVTIRRAELQTHTAGFWIVTRQ